VLQWVFATQKTMILNIAALLCIGFGFVLFSTHIGANASTLP